MVQGFPYWEDGGVPPTSLKFAHPQPGKIITTTKFLLPPPQVHSLPLHNNLTIFMS